MKKYIMIGTAGLLVAGAANAALVTGFDQRYVAGDFDGTTWTDSVGSADATANGTFNAITVNGVAAVENSGAGTDMTFTRATALGGAGFTIQTVIRIDGGNTDRRQGPIAMADGGWGGVFMGARAEADGNVNLRGGNQGTDGNSVLAIDSTMTGVTDGMWGIYTLLVDASAANTMTATLTALDGTSLWSATDVSGLFTDVNRINAGGALFRGELNQAPTEGWMGAIADVVVYDSVLSTTDLATNAAEFNTLYAAIPEPATLGLIAAFGGGLLFVRRRFAM